MSASVNIASVWKNVVGVWVNIGGVWRIIENGFTNIGGVWKGFFGKKKVKYYGYVAAFSIPRKGSLQAGTVGDYAVFAGGGGVWDPVSDAVEVYSSKLVRSTASSLSYPKCYGAAEAVGDYLLIAGGIKASNKIEMSSYVAAYNINLVKTDPSSLSTYDTKAYLAGVRNENYAIFGGGYSWTSGKSTTNTVDAYDANLVQTRCSSLHSTAYNVGSVSIAGYALLCGGRGSNQQIWTEISAYNNNLTKTTLSLGFGRYNMLGASTKKYGILAGGAHSGGSAESVEVFNTSLVRTQIADLSFGGIAAAKTLGEHVFIMKLADNYPEQGNTVSYDDNLVRTYQTPRTSLFGSDANMYYLAVAGDYLISPTFNDENGNQTYFLSY